MQRNHSKACFPELAFVVAGKASSSALLNTASGSLAPLGSLGVRSLNPCCRSIRAIADY